jgi:hypothetical protein
MQSHALALRFGQGQNSFTLEAGGGSMSDGREEREEREKRRELEERENREDSLDRYRVDQWQPERKES